MMPRGQAQAASHHRLLQPKLQATGAFSASAAVAASQFLRWACRQAVLQTIRSAVSANHLHSPITPLAQWFSVITDSSLTVSNPAQWPTAFSIKSCSSRQCDLFVQWDS